MDMGQKKETRSLTDILRYYGMPEENIDMAINQIAQGYGACRYLDGVKDGAEAVGSTAEGEKSKTRNKKIISIGGIKIVTDKVVYFCIDNDDPKCFKVCLVGPNQINNRYDTAEICLESFNKFAELMDKA